MGLQLQLVKVAAVVQHSVNEDHKPCAVCCISGEGGKGMSQCLAAIGIGRVWPSVKRYTLT